MLAETIDFPYVVGSILNEAAPHLLTSGPGLLRRSAARLRFRNAVLAWEEDVSTHGTIVVRTKPLGNAPAAHDVRTRQTDCEFGMPSLYIHRAAFFRADDAIILAVWDTVVGSEEFAKERIGHGVRVDGQ